MVNELCGNGLEEGSGATNCIFRDHCYELHSIGYTKEDSIYYDYPMSRCIQSRSKATDWIKMNFIRPEDLKLYNTIGINHFKITGRTGRADYGAEKAKAFSAKKVCPWLYGYCGIFVPRSCGLLPYKHQIPGSHGSA